MSFDSPFVEYLIIGFHTSIWVLLMILAIFKAPISILAQIDAGRILLFLPIIYMIGMLFDSITRLPLEPFRKKIRNSLFKYEQCKDELIAFKSPELYSSYQARVRRVRIIGTAIFNWLLLGGTILLHLDRSKPTQYIATIILALTLSVASIVAWKEYYKRAYKFRKNACDQIRESMSNQRNEDVTKQAMSQ